jgi:hypothetical protein
MLKRLLLGLLVAWAAAGFLQELHRAISGYDDREHSRADPWAWRYGTAPAVQLERCVAPARLVIPPHSAVAFASPATPPGNAVYRRMWAAYLLPAYDVFDVDDPAAPLLADYVIDCGAGFRHPWLAPLRDLPGGRLFRVQRR